MNTLDTQNNDFIVILNRLHKKVLNQNARLAKVTAKEEKEFYDALESLSDDDSTSMKSVFKLLMLRDAIKDQKSIMGQLSYAIAVVNYALAQAAIAMKNGAVDVAGKLVKFAKRVAKYTVKTVKKLLAVLNSAIDAIVEAFNKYVKPVLVGIKNGTIKVTTAVIEALSANLAAATFICKAAFDYISAKVVKLGKAIARAAKSAAKATQAAAVATKDATIHAVDVAVVSLGNAAVVTKTAVVNHGENAIYNAQAKPLKAITRLANWVAASAADKRADLQKDHILFKDAHSVSPVVDYDDSSFVDLTSEAESNTDISAPAIPAHAPLVDISNNEPASPAASSTSSYVGFSPTTTDSYGSKWNQRLEAVVQSLSGSSAVYEDVDALLDRVSPRR